MSEHGRGDRHGDRFRELEDAYASYTVYDEHYERIGRVDELFVDAEGREQYLGVKMGLLGTKSTLVPMEMVRVNDRRRLVEVATSRRALESAPTLHDNEEVSREYENRVHGYFGYPQPYTTAPGAGGDHPHETRDPLLEEGLVDTEYGERANIPMHPPEGYEPESSEPLGAPQESEPFPAEPARSSERPPLSEEPPRDGTLASEPPPPEEPYHQETPATGSSPGDERAERVRIRRLDR